MFSISRLSEKTRNTLIIRSDELNNVNKKTGRTVFIRFALFSAFYGIRLRLGLRSGTFAVRDEAADDIAQGVDDFNQDIGEAARKAV